MYKHVHVIGDSHVLHTAGMFHEHHICNEANLQGATAHNLISEQSTTNSRHKIDSILKSIDSQRDIILLIFGEVDCRFHLRDGVGCSATVNRYGEFIESVSKRGFRVIVQGVIGAVPQDNSNRVSDYPSIAKRGAIVHQFNGLLYDWCLAHNIEFFDTCTSGSGGALPAHLTDDGVHLSDAAAKRVYAQFAEEFDLGERMDRCVWCSAGMATFGPAVSEALGWPLYVDAPVGDCETVLIIGLYDPPDYAFSLSCTARAKKRVILWCGRDAAFLSRPDLLPDAIHLAVLPEYSRRLAEHGITAPVVGMPMSHTREMTPLPDKPSVACYLGAAGNGRRYGAQMVRALAESLPDVHFDVYTLDADRAALDDIMARTTVQLQVGETNGGSSCSLAMMAGRRCVTTNDMPYATVVRPDDFLATLTALNSALVHTELDTEASAYWREYVTVAAWKQRLVDAGVALE